MSMPNTLEVAKEHLFSSEDEMVRAGVPEVIRRRLLRLRDVYNYWLKFPDSRDRDIAQLLMKRYGLGTNIAYRDLNLIKTLLGEMAETTKKYHRYRFLCMLEKSFALAERRGDTRAMVSAAAAYGKYARLDKEDPADLGLDRIRPQSFEVSDDPSLAGFKPIPNVRAKIAALLKEMSVPGISDVEFEEVEHDEDSIFGPRRDNAADAPGTELETPDT